MDEFERPKPRIEIPALGTGKREGRISKEDAIRAIEAKLKALERHGDEDLEINDAAASSSSNQQVPYIQRFQFNKDRDTAGTSMGHGRGGRTYTKSAAPYNRNSRR